MSFLERTFKLKEHKTNVRTEIIAGITTFMTMAYILIVNPVTLSLKDTPDLMHLGMDFGGVFTATALSAVVATLVMAFFANYPFALAPGMGLNAFFIWSVVIGMGKSWQFALTAVLLEGILFLILSMFNIREAIVNSIPNNLKNSVSVGIGLFIAFIGLKGAGIIEQGGAIVQLGNVTSPTAIVAIIGIIVTGILLIKKVKGAILIGILLSTVISIPLGVTGLPTKLFAAPPSLAPVAFQFVGFDQIFSIDMLIVLFSFLFVDMFDTIGTLVGVSSKAGMLDEKGNLPKVKQALLADAIGTTFGACVGTSTVTTYVESASGVSEGGRTGLTAFTTAILFALALFLSPIFMIIPSAATAPALVLVGLFMMSPIMKVDLEDFTEAIPAFLTIIMMPLTYSISEGIAFGMVSYVVLNLLTGKFKKISPVMYVLAVLFIIKFAMPVIEKLIG